MANVLSIVTYKIFPPKLGGQKGIALFNQYFSEEVNLFCFTIRDNNPAGISYKVYNEMENGSGRYANAFNFFEILILLCFIMGMGMLMLALFAVAEGLIKIKLMAAAGYAFVGYSTWAIGSFFDNKKVMSYVKALIAYLLGMITFTVLALLVGALIDVLYKH